MPESIWFRDYQLDEIKPLCKLNLAEYLGIELIDLGRDSLAGTMPVDHRTTQPAGLLHGGASVALAETLGSIAANLCVDPDRWVCVGQEINASHLRPVLKGCVTGTAKALYLGRSSQVWDIGIVDERQRNICTARLTVAVVRVGHGGGKLRLFEDE